MSDMNVAQEKRPSLPQHFDNIEELLVEAHNITSRMRPLPGEDPKGVSPPTAAGIEEVATRVVESLHHLNRRLEGIADVVGQL